MRLHCFVGGSVLLRLLHFIGISVHGQTISDVRQLREHLFVNQSYDKRYRPVIDQTTPIDLFITFFLLAINEVDVTKETMRVTGYLELVWNDEFLTWDERDYDGLMMYNWPQDDVWKPVVGLRNSHTDYEPFGDSGLEVINDSNGDITWLTFKVFTSTCPMKVTYFPFDVQTCALKFVAWGYNPSQVDLLDNPDGMRTREYEANPQWDILETSSNLEQGDNDISLVFRLKLKRNPTYVIFTVLSPVLLLVILNLFVFLLPCDSGERVSYAVTVFLAFAVFFTVTSSILPEAVALFSIYVMIMTAQSVLICIIAIVQVRFSHKDATDEPVPKWLIALSRFGQCSLHRQQNHTARNKPRVRANKISDNQNVDEISNVTLKVESTETITEDNIGTDEIDNTCECESWRKAVRDTDPIFTVLFTILSMAITAICLGICATSE